MEVTTNRNKEHALSDLRLIKSYINDMLIGINEGITLTKEDIEAIHKLYEATIETKNQVIYNGVLPF